MNKLFTSPFCQPKKTNWWFSFAASVSIIFGLNQLASAQNIIWDKAIGGPKRDRLAAVQQTQDGGYILGGSSISNRGGDKSENSRGGYSQEDNPNGDFWIVKLNADRSKVWDKTFGGTGNDALYGLQQTADGGYILGGYSDTNKNGDKTEESRDLDKAPANYGGDFWIIKLNADGSNAWDKTYGGDYTDVLTSLQQTPDGGYILGGWSGSGKTGDKSEPNKGFDADYWVVKINADGSKVWDKTIGGTQDDALESIRQTPDGGYILGGTSYSGISGDKTSDNKGSSDYWLVKLTANGSIAWDKTYGGDKEDTFTTLQQTKDGGYLLGGYSQSGKSGDKTDGLRGNAEFVADYWVVKVDQQGNKQWDTAVGGHSVDELQSILQTPDGGYILGGQSSSGKSGEKSENSKGHSDYWIVKLNAKGKFVLDKTIGSNDYELFRSLILTSDNNFILGGTSASGESGDKTQASKGQSDYWIVKLQNDFLLNQTITFNPILNKNLYTPAFTLSAKASSNLPVTFRVLNGPATITKDKVTVNGLGQVTIEARQAGNDVYKPAADTQFFSVVLTTPTQDISFGGNKSDSLTAMLATADGGYMLGGTSNSPQTGDKSQSSKGSTDFWVVKTDKNGKRVWDKTFGGTQAEELRSIIATPDGGYLLGGSSVSGVSGDKSQASQGDLDYWIVKIDSLGNKAWDKTYGGAKYDVLASMVATSEGGYLLGGTSESGISGDKTQENKGSRDYWLVHINGIGEKIWDKAFGGDSYDQLAAIIKTEKGFLLGGTSSSSISGDKSQTPRGLGDYWIVRIDEKGTKLWDRTYGGIKKTSPYDEGTSGASTLSALVATPDGGYILGGSSNASKGGEKTQDRRGRYVNGSYRLQDYWIVKINAQGTKLWDKSYGGLVLHTTYWGLYLGDSKLRSIVALPNGGYLLGGSSDSERGGDKSEDTRSDVSPDFLFTNIEIDDNDYWNDYWLIKIDEQGNKLSDRTFGGNRNDQLTALALTNDGSYLLGGFSKSERWGDKSTTSQGRSDYWVVKVEDDTAPLLSSWDLRFGGFGNDNFTDAIRTTDGGYLAAGYTNSNKSGDVSQEIISWTNIGINHFWIVKTDQNGKKLWDQRYESNRNQYLNRVIQTQDGGYLLAGSQASYNNPKNRDYFLLKVPANGIFNHQDPNQWARTYGGTGYEELKKVIQLASGEYILAGSSNSPMSGSQTQPGKGGTDYWLVKISSTGQRIWDKRFGGDQDETLNSFVQTDDGGFLLVGSSLSGNTGDKSQASQGGSDYWVVQTDKNGNLVWEKSYGGSGQDDAYSVARSGKEFYLSGTSRSGKSGDKSQASQGGSDYWVVKINSKGTKIWDKTLGGNQDEELRASTLIHQNQLVVAGTSFSDKNGDKTKASQGSSDYWLVALDAQGNKIYDKQAGGSGTEELRSVLQTHDGSLLLGGRSDSDLSGDRTQPTQGSTDYWLVKVTPETTNIMAARTTTQVAESKTELTPWQAFPNPFQDKVTVAITFPQTQMATIKVLDSQGRELTTLFQQEAQANQTYQLEWQAGNQPAGMYLLQLQTPTGQKTQKVLLAK